MARIPFVPGDQVRTPHGTSCEVIGFTEAALVTVRYTGTSMCDNFEHQHLMLEEEWPDAES